MKYMTLAVLIILGILLIGGCSVAVAAAEQVDPGEVRVVTQFGEPTGRVLHPGLSWINPLYGQDAVSISVQPRTYETGEYPENSKADFTDYRTSARTTNGQKVDISYSVVFRVPSDDEAAVCFIENYGSDMAAIVERVVKPQSRSAARLHTQSYTAEELFGGTKVFDYADDVNVVLVEKFKTLGCGLVLDDFLVRGIDFDPDYVQTIEDQQIEEEKIKTESFKALQAVEQANAKVATAEGDAKASVVAANAAAEVRVIDANAKASEVKIQAEAEANAILTVANSQSEAYDVVGRSLDRYPNILSLEFIQDGMKSVDWGLLPSDGILPLLPLEVPGQ